MVRCLAWQMGESYVLGAVAAQGSRRRTNPCSAAAPQELPGNLRELPGCSGHVFVNRRPYRQQSQATEKSRPTTVDFTVFFCVFHFGVAHATCCSDRTAWYGVLRSGSRP